MKELLAFLFIFMGPALSSDPTDSKVKRSIFPPGSGWNVQPTPPDFDSLTSWPGAENPWKSYRDTPEPLQSLQPPPGWNSLGVQQTAPPVVISKHTIIEKSVPVSRPVIVERRIPVQVDKYVPYPVDRIVNKPVPVAVPHPVPYPVDRPVQIPVHHRVAVPVQQPYPVPVTIRQRVPYPVAVPVIVTAQGLIPASSINLSGSQNGLNGLLSLPLPMLSPLAINAGLGQGAQPPLPEGLGDSRDPGLASPIEDNFLHRGRLQGDSIPWDLPQAGISNDPWAQAPHIKWKRSSEEEKKEEKSSP